MNEINNIENDLKSLIQNTNELLDFKKLALKLLKMFCEYILEVDIDNFLGCKKGEHNKDRKDYRNGYRSRTIQLVEGALNLKIPRVRNTEYVPPFLPNRTQFEHALIVLFQECYIKGLSTRKIRDLANELGVNKISTSQISIICKKLDAKVEAFRHRNLNIFYPILFVDSLYESIKVGDEFVKKAVMIVQGINENGYREILAIEIKDSESEDNYVDLFNLMKERGLNKTLLVVSDSNQGLVNAIKKSFPSAMWQRCLFHFKKNIFDKIKRSNFNLVKEDLLKIWESENIEKAYKAKQEFSIKYEDVCKNAIKCLDDGFEDSITFYIFNRIQHSKINTTNTIERLNEEIRRRTKSIRVFPSEESYIRLVGSYLIQINQEWQERVFISKDILKIQIEELESKGVI